MSNLNKNPYSYDSNHSPTKITNDLTLERPTYNTPKNRPTKSLSTQLTNKAIGAYVGFIMLPVFIPVAIFKGLRRLPATINKKSSDWAPTIDTWLASKIYIDRK